MSITPEIMKSRSFRFALSTLRVIDKLNGSVANDIMGRQVMRSATSVGANYRSACKAKSTADFINNLKIVEEEADESVYWLELIKEFNSVQSEEFEALLRESKELDRIFSKSAITAKNNNKIK
ncbi:MAG: four helix bundle protein [bacterium]|nr:four helix bundle protein [bacterium]